MNKLMVNTIGGIVFIIMGLCFVIYHKQLGHKTFDFYYRLLHINLSEKGYQIVFLVCGMVFAIFGLLSLLQIIRFK